MNDVKKLCEKIIKQSGDNDAYYHYGVEYSSDQKHPIYKAYIGWSREGVQPLSFSEPGKKLLVDQMEIYLASPKGKHVSIMYHRSMAAAMARAMQFHMDTIKLLENPPKAKKK